MEVENKIIKIDFSKDFDFSDSKEYFAYLKGEKITFILYKKYIGPITNQYLPNGGIQSLFNYKLIIKVNNGFLEVDKVKFKDETMDSKTFIERNGSDNLMNQVLE